MTQIQGTSKPLSYENERNPNKCKEKFESQKIKKPNQKCQKCYSKSNNKIQ